MKTHVFEFLVIPPDGFEIPADTAHDCISVEIETEENEKIPKLIERVISLALKRAFMDYKPEKINKGLINRGLCDEVREIFGEINFYDIYVLDMNLSNTIGLNGQAYRVKIVPKETLNKKNVLSKIRSLIKYILNR